MKGTGRPAALALGIVMLLAVGCASSGPGGGPASATPPTSQTVATSSGAGPATASASVGRVPAPAHTVPAPAHTVPAPAHTVVVMMENHAYSEVIGSAAAPFLNRLAGEGAVFTQSYAITHPSEPNYLALFSGSTHGVTADSCPVELTAPNLAADLIAAGKTFAGYSEDLPSVGSAVCSAGEYARKHVPWADFRNVPGSVSMPFTSFPATDLNRLPTVSFVIPNLCDDMHDCSVATGDAWLRAHLSDYASWAMRHDSLLIITWDEDDGSQSNQIPTIFVGQQVRPGRYGERITHYRVLATLEAAYGLPRDGNAASAAPITDVWRS
jgi:phosphatidylinositol-3-phosphatase